MKRAQRGLFARAFDLSDLIISVDQRLSAVPTRETLKGQVLRYLAVHVHLGL